MWSAVLQSFQELAALPKCRVAPLLHQREKPLCPETRKLQLTQKTQQGQGGLQAPRLVERLQGARYDAGWMLLVVVFLFF